MQHRVARSLLVDCLKALAALLIVLHHLAFYGPMGDEIRPLVPRLWDWLASDARMAVQVFLVVAGFLCARSLAPTGHMGKTAFLPAVRSRFLRIALPYHAVLVLAVACNELARLVMPHPSISAPPALGQLLAHALLLQDVLGYESLSAGLWYVAIDLQLFVLMTALLAIGRQADEAIRALRLQRLPDASRLSILLVSAAGLASLLYFNRTSGWEAWGVHFFGAYALGAVAWWSTREPRGGWWLAAMTACAAAALLLTFRERLVVALVVALLLGISFRQHRSVQSAEATERLSAGAVRAIRWLATNSYAIFLVHFPICLLVNAVFTRYAPHAPSWQAAGIVVAVASSIGAGTLFHALVERPLLRQLSHRPSDAVLQAPLPT